MLQAYLFFMICMNSVLGTQLFITNTDPSIDFRPEHHCLQYFHQEEWNFVIQLSYCFRSLASDSEEISGHVDQPFTFEQLQRQNVTSEELLTWSVPADLVEDYQDYLNHRYFHLASQEVYRCSKPWFGSRCQYIFPSVENPYHFLDIIHQIMRPKLNSYALQRTNNESCYIHLDCTDHGTSICLAWYQVCDGQIDCIDGGEDEASCFLLETNECKKNEYRCHNGLCIPQDFLENSTPECLDQSDTVDKIEPAGFMIDLAYTVWREHHCPPGEKNFLCDDRECIRPYQTCANGQPHPAIGRIILQGSLSTSCWMSMICLTKVHNQVNRVSCEQYMSSIDIPMSISTCDPLIAFPTKPVLLHHVRFLYYRDYLLLNQTSQAVTPTYICYDQDLCEHLQPTFYHENLTCRHSSLMGLNASSFYETWISIIDTIRPFFQGCMLPSQKRTKATHSSLYCCQNSSKCISQHRLIDGIIDCPYHDDEQAVEQSCSIQHAYRFRCHNEKQCRSPLFSTRICPSRPFRELKELLFHEICDRIVHITPQLIDGKNHTDETECEQWECNNVYTRCDHFWNCPNGEDEINCRSSVTWQCPPGTLQCVSFLNYTIICLSNEKIGDGVMDCLGGTDEQNICRRDMREPLEYPGFQCYNDTKCVFQRDLCDTLPNCQYGDDESFCNGRINVCSKRNPFPTTVETFICESTDIYRPWFSLNELAAYPLKSNQSHVNTNTRLVSSVAVARIIGMNDLGSTCHYGLPVTIRLNTNRNDTRCLCPPSFYGDRCQYQSQRVSVTMKVYPVKRYGIQSFFIRLTSENDHHEEQLHSYHRTNYILYSSCGKTFKFFLLYSTQPKNISLNYYVTIDAFNQTTLTYLASWRYRVPFVFLPVNPVNIVIRVPATPESSSKQCQLSCGIHGRCLKYLNENSFFCRCDSGWDGKFCNRRINCDDCGSGSVCVGMHVNRSICMCPINTFGRRCLLKYPCSDEMCYNGGKCVITDENNIDNYGCICSEKFHQIFCGGTKYSVQVFFEDIETSSYLSVYVSYSVGNEYGYDKLFMKMFSQKLRMLQQSTIFYIEGTFHFMIIETNDKYYLALLRPEFHRRNISTNLTPAQECPRFKVKAHPALMNLPEIRRVKYYHKLCRNYSNLMCFIDDLYFCLCTIDRHANCFAFVPKYYCPENVHCQNGGQCLLESAQCPTNTYCVCSGCFYGDRCQFFAKGIGLILDDMLRYEFQPSADFQQQSSAVKVTAIVAIVIFVVGALNTIFCLMVFHSRRTRQVGVGMYLYASSITSLLTVTLFNMKVWFLIITHIRSSTPRWLLHGACTGLEPVLKFCLYTTSWLNACVAIERAVTVQKQRTFKTQTSKRIARWVIALIPIVTLASLSHEFIYRDLSDDAEEDQVWCVFEYSKPMIIYSTFILSFHNLGPFLVNLVSAVFIIQRTARRKAELEKQRTFKTHLRQQIRKYQHLIVSPILLAVLALPRLITSFITDCVKINNKSLLYLYGYLISFIPAIVAFLVFVLPSPLYRQEFFNSIKLLKRRLARIGACCCVVK